MSERITVTTLRAVCGNLNRRVGFDDDTPLWRRVGDRNVATIGMYYVDGAYGGWSLYRIENEGGGVSDPFRVGHVPARELYGLMWAYIEGGEQLLDAAARRRIKSREARKARAAKQAAK